MCLDQGSSIGRIWSRRASLPSRWPGPPSPGPPPRAGAITAVRPKPKRAAIYKRLAPPVHAEPPRSASDPAAAIVPDKSPGDSGRRLGRDDLPGPSAAPNLPSVVCPGRHWSPSEVGSLLVPSRKLAPIEQVNQSSDGAWGEAIEELGLPIALPLLRTDQNPNGADAMSVIRFGRSATRRISNPREVLARQW